MSEPFFGAQSPDGRWIVRVADPEAKGLYFATVTLDGLLIDSLTTEDTTKLISWTKRQMKEAMRRSSS